MHLYVSGWKSEKIIHTNISPPVIKLNLAANVVIWFRKYV